MRRALLDVSVLLALLDADHAQHALVARWAVEEMGAGWASCAITENGFVRIVSQPRYTSPLTTAAAARLLARTRSHGPHEFWPCDVSLLDHARADASRLLGPQQVTDAYLLALAVAHEGQFVTLDGRVDPSVVTGATSDHLTVL